VPLGCMPSKSNARMVAFAAINALLSSLRAEGNMDLEGQGRLRASAVLEKALALNADLVDPR
jgi:hypothetical protein